VVDAEAVLMGLDSTVVEEVVAEAIAVLGRPVEELVFEALAEVERLVTELVLEALAVLDGPAG